MPPRRTPPLDIIHFGDPFVICAREGWPATVKQSLPTTQNWAVPRECVTRDPHGEIANFRRRCRAPTRLCCRCLAPVTLQRDDALTVDRAACSGARQRADLHH